MKIFFASFIMLFLVSGLQAQCRNAVRVVNQPYIAPIVHHDVVREVITPIAVPVLIPAFQFQYAPPPPCVMPALSPPAVVPQNPGFTPGFGSAPTASPAFGSKDKIKELAKALLEEMSKQSAPGAGATPNPETPKDETTGAKDAEFKEGPKEEPKV